MMVSKNESDGRTQGIFRKVDAHVGLQLRERRTGLRVPIESLARELGITLQQFEEYELGARELMSDQLYTLSRLLQVSPDYFYEGLSDMEAKARPHMN